VVRLEGNEVVSVASTWDLEASENPDGVEGPHAHPYGLAAGPDGMLWVADAGGNDLLKVDPESGEVSLVAVFGAKEITDPESGETFPAEAVPTGVTFGGDGNLYVTFFHGGVSRVTPQGEVSSYNEDVMFATDIEAAPDGNLYVVQIADVSFGPATGSVVRVNQDGASEVVLDGLSSPTSIAFSGEGDAYLTLSSLGAPGSGEVVKVEALTELSTADQTPAPLALEARSSGWTR
jgi:sugar lactone lactonase YvrE